MNWMLGLAGLAGMLVVSWKALQMLGAMRWTALIRSLSDQLESARLGALGRLPSPVRFDARELEGLPAPVRRYFRKALTDGQAIIAAANIVMTGTINLSASAERWKPFRSQQRVITGRPGFLWDAQVDMLPGLPARVLDSYIAGRGGLLAKLLGLLTVADAQGDPETARAEFMRYFAEAAWYPTALLPSQGVQWQAVDDSSASATLADGPITLTLLFRFNDAGLIASVHAEQRGAGADKDGVMLMLPWDCGLSDYRAQDGMLIPLAGTAAWLRPAGRKAYFVGQVKTVSYEYLA